MQRDLRASVTVVLKPLLEVVGADPGHDVDPEVFLYEGVLTFLRAVHENPRTWRLVLMPPRGRSRELRARIEATRALTADRVRLLLAWAVARRGGPPGLDLPLFARLIVAAGEDAARLTLVHPRRYPPQRLAALARDAVAVLPPGAQPRGASPPAVVGSTRPPVALKPAAAPSTRMPQAERREHLLDVTLDILAEHGFEGLSMQAVAARAGVNRTIVYRSFANLQVLLLALLRREDARTRAMLDTLLPSEPGDRTVPELLTGTLAAFLDAVAGAPRTYRLVLQRPETAPLVLQKLVNQRRAALAERLRPLVEWGMAGVAAPTEGLDVDVLCRLLLSSGEALGRLALDDPDCPPQRILESTWTLLDAIPLS